MANKYPLPYAFARSHQLLLEDDGTRLTLWLCPDSAANAISEVMRKWGNDNASLEIAREESSSLKQRISQAYTTQYGTVGLHHFAQITVDPKAHAGVTLVGFNVNVAGAIACSLR
jgi:hypothetical protein